MKRYITLISALLCLCLCYGGLMVRAESPQSEDAPRVVDNAGLFLSAEAEQMETRLSEIRGEIGKDIVIYTDVTAYGVSHAERAEDFYDFNGYGVGADKEGVCLFACMDPEDRGWWACCTGPVTMSLYTESAANALDDALYEYMAAGRYAEGVADWIENVRTLYVKGIPFAPDWWPDQGAEFRRFHDETAPRIVDDYGSLTASELQSLTEHASAISQKYGLDIVVHTSYSPDGLPMRIYCEKFYEYNGYGYGENYDGILLTIFPDTYSPVNITGFGIGNDKLSGNNWERLYDQTRDRMASEGYAQGIAEYLRLVDHMERTGRVPRTAGYWTLITLLGAALGSTFGGIALGSAKHKMGAPMAKRDANQYILTDNTRITSLGSSFLYTTSSKRYAPMEPRSTSSGGGSSDSGGSSYSGSYIGSSGSTHSGSGRKF